MVFCLALIFSNQNAFAAAKQSVSLEKLLKELSDPTKSAESDAILNRIFEGIQELVAQKRFFTASRLIDQLEPARLGRTYTLVRFPEKREIDAQIIKIRKFIAAFYLTKSQFEKDRGLDEEAIRMKGIADEYSAAVQNALQSLKGQTEADLTCFEDEQGSLPFSNTSSSIPMIPIPTKFFVFFPPSTGIAIPSFSPFTFLPTSGATLDVALNPNWSWYFGNWGEIAQSLVTGISPTGQQIIWVAGPLSGNHCLSCSQDTGRWIISAGEKKADLPSSPRYLFTGNSLPEPFAAAQEPLKSKGMAGFTFRAITSLDVASFSSAPREGVLINEVFPDTPAESAGMAAGDILVEYGGTLISGESRLKDVISQKYACENVPFELWRQGKLVRTALTLAEPPRETASDLNIEYTLFKLRENRLRAVFASPKAVSPKKLPGLLIVSALESPRLRQFPGLNFSRELAFLAAQQGFCVLRFELRGSGDSEGRDYRETDFQTELGDNLAALDFLYSRPEIDPKKVFVFGHSTGGIVAAWLAGQRPVSGLIVSGSIGRSYVERTLETIRLQGQLAGKTETEIDGTVKDYLVFFSSLLSGDPLATIVQKHPTLSRFVNQNQRIMDDRTLSYWHQQLNLNLASIYSKVRAPTLLLYNACDFITTRACHEWMKNVMNQAGNNQVSLRIIEEADHHYARVKDFAESHRSYQTGKASLNPDPIKVIVDWLLQHKESLLSGSLNPNNN